MRLLPSAFFARCRTGRGIRLSLFLVVLPNAQNENDGEGEAWTRQIGESLHEKIQIFKKEAVEMNKWKCTEYSCLRQRFE